MTSHTPRFPTGALATLLAVLGGCASTDQSEEDDKKVLDTLTGTPLAPTTKSFAYDQAPDFDTAELSTGGLKQDGTSASAECVVYFDFDSFEIRADGQPVVAANAQYLIAHAKAKTQLEGHTDERGSREYNIALGERRAQAVRQTLIALGVKTEQVRTVSYGEEQPAATGTDEASYALNRRVELVY